ncbi:MAG: hypothetical protein WC534_02760 [Candidatus Paceibacterota bacterium]
MGIIQKILIGALSVVALGVSVFFLSDNFSKQNNSLDTPEKIVSDYKDLLAEAEQLKTSAGNNCDNKNVINKKIESLEKKLADLTERKKQWLESVPKLPDVEPEVLEQGRPGSEVPELTSDVPPLPDITIEEIPGSQTPDLTPDYPPLPEIDMESINILGSEVPELTSDVPPLPEINIDVINPTDYIPELPEINTGRPGSEVPELTPDVPPLPDIEIDIIDPNEKIFQMQDCEQKINNILQQLKALCQDEESAKKSVSDKCSDACQRHKACAAFTEDVTSADLNNAYNSCMEECATWPKDMIKCINTVEIKKPNDCVNFVQCQLPQFYEGKYLK